MPPYLIDTKDVITSKEAEDILKCKEMMMMVMMIIIIIIYLVFQRSTRLDKRLVIR
jgi:hypothetical protein